MRPSLRRWVQHYRPQMGLGRLPVEARYATLTDVAIGAVTPLDGMCMHTPRGALILIDPDCSDPLAVLRHELVHAEQMNLGLPMNHDARFWARLQELDNDSR